ncbi:MAG: hypothetical protein Q8K26_01975 [Candidatus Gracilibacteria bacterium]|nr:hypothetical protein [Candidatus Gracilibacteria bacterium]
MAVSGKYYLCTVHGTHAYPHRLKIRALAIQKFVSAYFERSINNLLNNFMALNLDNIMLLHCTIT